MCCIPTWVGEGLGAYLLYHEVPPGVDPLGPQNILAFCTGPLTGVQVPTAGRSSVTTLSPLTRTILDSNSGTAFGVRLKWAGYDALVITGRASEPVWLEVNEDGVQFHPATDLWGSELPAAVKRLHRKDGAGVAIGPAGENGVLFATIASEDGKSFGRGGVGAVMGAKNLKAIVATGTMHPSIADERALEFVEYETRQDAGICAADFTGFAGIWDLGIGEPDEYLRCAADPQLPGRSVRTGRIDFR